MWKYLEGNENVSIDLDGVNRKLTSRYISEINSVVHNVLTTLAEEKVVDDAGQSKFYLQKLPSMLDILNFLLPESLLQRVREHINNFLSNERKDLVSSSELLGVLLLHMLCASYGESPAVVCSQHEWNSYLQLGFSVKRYNLILAALSGTLCRKSIIHNGTYWNSQSSKVSHFVLELEEQLAAINRRLLFNPHSTICSLDDDHLRLSSRAVTDLTSLRSVNNPLKEI